MSRLNIVTTRKNLRNLVMSAASQLQDITVDGKPATSDDWQDIADDLARAATLAQREANLLAEDEFFADKERLAEKKESEQ